MNTCLGIAIVIGILTVFVNFPQMIPVILVLLIIAAIVHKLFYTFNDSYREKADEATAQAEAAKKARELEIAQNTPKPDHEIKHAALLSALDNLRKNSTDTNVQDEYTVAVREWLHATDKSRALKEAAYISILQELKFDPTNPHLHTLALVSGRRHYKFLWKSFDDAEEKIQNEIRAVTANASQVSPIYPIQAPPEPTPAQLPAAPTTSIEERVNALKKMKESGLLSDEEFEQKRKDILDSI
jgi:hypothetical protein